MNPIKLSIRSKLLLGILPLMVIVYLMSTDVFDNLKEKKEIQNCKK